MSGSSSLLICSTLRMQKAAAAAGDPRADLSAASRGNVPVNPVSCARRHPG